MVASASFTGMAQSPVKITVQVILGSTERAPMVKALMFLRTWGMGLAAIKPIFLDLDMCPATTPFKY